MEETIVMKIIIGLTIIIILGFIYLLRENKVLDSKASSFVPMAEHLGEELYGLRHEVYGLREQLAEQEHIVSTMNHRLDEHEHKLSQQDGLIEQIRHRVDAHEIRLFP